MCRELRYEKQVTDVRQLRGRSCWKSLWESQRSEILVIIPPEVQRNELNECTLFLCIVGSVKPLCKLLFSSLSSPAHDPLWYRLRNTQSTALITCPVAMTEHLTKAAEGRRKGYFGSQFEGEVCHSGRGVGAGDQAR